MSSDHTQLVPAGQPARPFRAAVWRGLGGLLPPLLTVVVIVTLLQMVQRYVLVPVESGLNWTLAQWMARAVLPDDVLPDDGPTTDGLTAGGAEGPAVKRVGDQTFHRASDGRYVPAEYFAAVDQHEGSAAAEAYTSQELCQRYVEHTFLRPSAVIPALLLLFILAMYFLGKLLSRRLVQFAWRSAEQMIRRVPLVRNVYSSIQQVTNFLLERHNLRDAEVVAVEYPRERMWTLGYVTGDGLADVADASGEPLVSVLMDTSPVPFNGFTCMVPRRQIVRLNLSMDEALQYIISCGVITPGRKPPQGG